MEKLEQSVSAFERLLKSRGYSHYKATRISIFYEAKLALALESGMSDEEIEEFKDVFRQKFLKRKKKQATVGQNQDHARRKE